MGWRELSLGEGLTKIKIRKGKVFLQILKFKMPTVDIEIKQSGFWVFNTKVPSSEFVFQKSLNYSFLDVSPNKYRNRFRNRFRNRNSKNMNQYKYNPK